MWDDFVALAAECHLHVKYKKIFHDVFREQREGNGGCLLKKMGVLTENGQFLMSGDEWDIAREHS